jgi:RNA polymerase sigma-70 factor (ECF subfamily)
VPSPQIAEEVVSDVFYKVWKNRERIEIKTSFESYVFKAVKNQSLDFLKSKANAIAYKTESMPVIYDGVTESPEEQMVIKELDARIEAAIESLPPQCKTIFKSSRFQGLKYNEIAEKLNISVKTVETQMGRALKHLRHVLRSEMPKAMSFIAAMLMVLQS